MTLVLKSDSDLLSQLHDETSLLELIAELSLEDINEIQASRKGKETATAVSRDEDLAFQLFAEEARSLVNFTKDVVLARSIDSALETDSLLVQELERADACARDDHDFALALSQGRSPPSRTSRSIGVVSGSSASHAGRVSALSQLGNNAVSSSMASSSRSTLSFKTTRTAPAVEIKRETCVFCREMIEGLEMRAPCGHFWDIRCLVELFRAATTDESLYPPRCCQQPFSVSGIQRHLPTELLSAFNKKSIEFSTTDRVYCHRPTCSAFLGAATGSPSVKTCRVCWFDTCGFCKERAHPSNPCPTDDTPILALADEEGWKRCPGCRHLVELSQGCYHMTCRCRKQFCYVCTETWKNCHCPQWDEARLLVTAENRVQRQLPAGAPPAPVQYRQMIAQAAERLRDDHDCQHTWRYRPGGGQCENCSHYLGVFLLNCRYCQMNVCVRCRRNRL